MFMLRGRLRTVRTPSRSYPGRRRGWVFVFALAVGVALSCGGRSRAAKPGSEQGMASLSFLVLPFANPSGDPDQNYVAVNVTSDLTTRLSGIAGSVVIARSSALAIASQSLPLAEIGRLFGVRYVLRGEVFTEGKQNGSVEFECSGLISREERCHADSTSNLAWSFGGRADRGD